MTSPKTPEMARSSLREIYAPIEGDLKEFSAVLKRELASRDALISEIHDHLLQMTGKFLRPALTLLTGKIGPKPRSREILHLAVSIELIHTATLVHDDIIDGSTLRRNLPSVPSKWGKDISIVSGDYLYAKAFLLLAGLKDVWVNEAFAACAHRMCEGEMKQVEKRSDFLMDESQYLEIIEKKTAALFQAACAGGAYFSGAGTAVVEAMARYGMALGMAFQIVDDCLDLSGEPESLGKNPGHDLDKSDVTLPMLYLFEELPKNERQSLLTELKAGGAASFSKIRRLAEETRALEKAMERARRYADTAMSELSALKPSPTRESLSQAAQYCLERAR